MSPVNPVIARAGILQDRNGSVNLGRHVALHCRLFFITYGQESGNGRCDRRQVGYRLSIRAAATAMQTARREGRYAPPDVCASRGRLALHRRLGSVCRRPMTCGGSANQAERSELNRSPRRVPDRRPVGWVWGSPIARGHIRPGLWRERLLPLLALRPGLCRR